MTQPIVPEQFLLSGGSRYWVHYTFNPSGQFGEPILLIRLENSIKSREFTWLRFLLEPFWRDFNQLGEFQVKSSDYGSSCGAPHHRGLSAPPRARRRSLWKNRGLLVFATCLFLFQLAIASMLPLAGEEPAYGKGVNAPLVISALIIFPQVIVALTAPWAERQADTWGRRPLLLAGFAVLPIRALVFAWRGH